MLTSKFVPSPRFSARSFGASLVCASVYAATPAEMQKARHEHYEELGDAFKAVRDQTQGLDALISPRCRKGRRDRQKASVNQQQWFPKGTGPEAGKTRALPEIWSKPADFTAAQKMFAERAPKLSPRRKRRTSTPCTAAFKEVGGACKNCHDTFRSPEE